MTAPEPTTTVFARRVEPGHEEQYEEWLSGIARASADAPGYQGTTVLRPAGAREDYIAITHFDSREHMKEWLESAERAQWLERLSSISLEREEVTSLGGMERWFTLPEHAGPDTPPRWKTACTILLGLYPLTLVVGTLLAPALRHLPGPLQVLLMQGLCVPLMVWVVLPWLTRRLKGWLHPRRRVRAPEVA